MRQAGAFFFTMRHPSPATEPLQIQRALVSNVPPLYPHNGPC